MLPTFSLRNLYLFLLPFHCATKNIFFFLDHSFHCTLWMHKNPVDLNFHLIVLPLSEKLPLAFFTVQIYRRQILKFQFIWKWLFFCYIFKVFSPDYNILGWWFLSFNIKKSIIPLFYGLRSFWEVSLLLSSFLYRQCASFFGLLLGFSLYFCFLAVWLWCM